MGTIHANTLDIGPGLHEKASYVVPVTAFGSEEQFLSSCANDVVVAAAAPVAVAVAVADASEELSWAALASAVFALLASTPVPAARPITAAESRAMMVHSTKTRTVQPHIVPFFFPSPAGFCDPLPSAAACGLGDVGSNWLLL